MDRRENAHWAVEMSMAKMMILPIIDRCGGCRECETVCSWAHNMGVINPRRGRITVVKNEAEGIYIPVMCQQCEKPYCMKVCPTGAIVEDSETGVKRIQEDVCIGCKMCILACPFGGVAFDPDKGKAVKCDLCYGIGEPQCVKWCPKSVLNYIDEERMGSVKRGISTEKLMAMLCKKLE